ncbi:MAG: Arm DNA-binding domain-containing protein [Pseudomonadota bacterium]
MGDLTDAKAKKAGPGKYGDGDGLQLSVSAKGARKWILRFMLAGRAREMGLGAYPEVSLAQARNAADVAPSFYPAVSSLGRLVMACWPAVETGSVG